MANTTIRSRSNPIVKRAAAVSAGKEPDTLALEGERLVHDAIDAGHVIEVALVAESRADLVPLLERKRVDVKLVDDALMQRLSRLKTPPGVIALAPAPPAVSIADLDVHDDSLILVSAGVADPGNLGALARSAEAFGAQALAVALGGTSPWNEKALRGSMGSLLRLPVSFGSGAEAIADRLRSRGWRQVVAATRGGLALDRFDWRGPVALWMGAETGDLAVSTHDFERVTIPMAGKVESLNVAVAASLLLFASGRMKIPRSSERATRGSKRG